MVQSDTVGRCLAFSRDGTRVAPVVRNVVTLWDVSKREELLAVHGRTIAFQPGWHASSLVGAGLDRTTVGPARRVRKSCRSIRIAVTAPVVRTTTPEATI